MKNAKALYCAVGGGIAWVATNADALKAILPTKAGLVVGIVVLVAHVFEQDPNDKP